MWQLLVPDMLILRRDFWRELILIDDVEFIEQFDDPVTQIDWPDLTFLHFFHYAIPEGVIIINH